MPNNNFSPASQRFQEAILRFPALWLLLICLVVYGRGLGGDFVLDDWPVVKENSHITDFGYLADYFTGDVWGNTELNPLEDSESYPLYRPLFLVALNAGHHLWGDNPVGYHALSILVHGINTILLFYLILGFLPANSTLSAFFSATLFAVHPVHVESVSWISGLTDPLASMFLLGTFLLYRRYTTTKRTTFAILALTCFASALLCKEVAIFFPLVLISYDWIKKQSGVMRHLPYFSLIGVYFLIRGAALDQGMNWSAYDLTKFPTLVEYAFRYIQLTVIPWPLDFYIGAPADMPWAIGAGALLALCALIHAANALRKNHREILFGYVWFGITLAPALPLALMGPGIFAIRVLYLPVAGLSLLAALLLQAHRTRAQIILGATSILLVFSVISIIEIADWKDEATAYAKAAESNPYWWNAVDYFAQVYEVKGHPERAIEMYLLAARLTNTEEAQLDNLEKAASLLGQTGNLSQSEIYFQETITRSPQRSSAWIGLGNLALARQDDQRAIGFYKKAFQVDPRNFIAPYNLALTYRRIGDIEKAQYFENIARQLQQQP